MSVAETSKLALMIGLICSGVGLLCWALATSAVFADPTVIAGALAFFGLLVLGGCVESAGRTVAESHRRVAGSIELAARILARPPGLPDRPMSVGYEENR